MKAFRDRLEAGHLLAERLASALGNAPDLVLALPRGGVPVAFPIAMKLGSPLDILLVRKLGVPGHEELAIGAIASGGIRVINRGVFREMRMTEESLRPILEREKRELERQELGFRRGTERLATSKQEIVLVDDGLATGATMRAAIAALRMEKAAGITVAVPVASADTSAALREQGERVICLLEPEDFFSVGEFYQDFSATEDREVIELLDRAQRKPGRLNGPN